MRAPRGASREGSLNTLTIEGARGFRGIRIAGRNYELRTYTGTVHPWVVVGPTGTRHWLVGGEDGYIHLQRTTAKTVVPEVRLTDVSGELRELCTGRLHRGCECADVVVAGRTWRLGPAPAACSTARPL